MVTETMNLLLQKYEKFFSSDEIFEIFRKYFNETELTGFYPVTLK